MARAEALGPDLHAVVGTSLDKGVELDALAKMPEPERRELVQRAQAGEQVSARSENTDRIQNLLRVIHGDFSRLAKYATPEQVQRSMSEIETDQSLSPLVEAFFDAIAPRRGGSSKAMEPRTSLRVVR